MMYKRIFLSVVALLFMLVSCSASDSNGKQPDDKSTEQVTAVVDSLMALEPDMTLTSLSVVKAPMPSFMAEEVKPALKKSADLLGAYILGQALGGKKSSNEKEMVAEIVTIGAPLREAMKKYESEDHPDFVFGLAKVVNNQDSTKNERRLYVFEENDLSSVKEVNKFSSKTSNDIAMLFALAFGDQIDIDNRDMKLEDLKVVKDSPILKFIVSK